VEEASVNPLLRPPERPRLLLVGEVGARPDGLERALIQGGFAVADGTMAVTGEGLPPDVILATAGAEAQVAPLLERIRKASVAGVPVLVTLGEGDRDAVARTIELGAADVIPAPVHLPELVARLVSRVRGGRESSQAVLLAQQSSRLFDIFQDIAVAIRPEEILHTLVRRLGDVLGLSHCACVFVTSGRDEARLVALHDNPRVRDVPVDLSRYPEVREAVRTRTTVFVPDVISHPLFLEVRNRWDQLGMIPDVRSAAAIPLFQQGHPIGALALRSRLTDPLRAEQLWFAERLVRGATRVLESQERRAAITRRQGAPDVRDPLTGCASLDALDHRLKEEFERARRYGLSFSLVLLDVDRLADVNQHHGTEAGDRALADLGSILQGEIRGPDFVARYGGDEFALLLPETTLDGARQSVTRMRNRVGQHPFIGLSHGERPSLSAGIVAFPHPAAVHTEDLFALAESALIRAKGQDGERIGVADPVAA
jgi:two-component system cell cycle response regulator